MLFLTKIGWSSGVVKKFSLKEMILHSTRFENEIHDFQVLRHQPVKRVRFQAFV